jgi:hypothetical protein
MDDFDRYSTLAAKMRSEQYKLQLRACEVFLRIYTEYLKKDDPYENGWYDGWLADACRQQLGLTSKDSRLTDVDVSIEDGTVYLHSTVCTQGETDDLYHSFDAKFLWDEDALTKWITGCRQSYQDAIKRKQEQKAAEVEAKERAELERLKAKYET